MVWKFLDTTKEPNARLHAEMSERIADWWKEFAEKKSDIEKFLRSELDWNIDEWMTTALQVVDEEIMWEFGAEISGDYQLIITPESERQLRPLVNSIIEQAPQIASWRFYAYRQPQNFSDTEDIVLDRTGIKISDMKAIVQAGDGNLVDVLFVSSNFKPAKEETFTHAAFLTTEYSLGEEILDNWIGAVQVVSPTDPIVSDLDAEDYANLMDLPNLALREINNIRAELPAKQIYQLKESLQRADFSLEPEKSDDYAERLDMVAASTLLPEMWKSAHSGFPFDSVRFSRHGERFCYLKMDGQDSYANSAQSRDRLAKTLDEKLAEANLGCTIGGAGGLRYSYIDLCLTDVESSLPVIRKVMQYEHMPNRSWLLFFDADWSDEWVGIFPETPTPPTVKEFATTGSSSDND